MSQDFQKYTRKLIDCCANITHTDEESLYRYSFDGLKISFLPEAVIIPHVESQIAAVLELANKGKVPITVRGSGSTLTGAATPIRGGWVLDLSKLDQIIIDPQTRMAEVGCGAVIKNIQEAANAVGFFYPPDPSSHKWCTIGGNIACNAGGLRCVKYGVTRDYVLALKGYLPTGEFVEWAKPVRKFATAYNIRDLWIGSEGTLGIITSATLKLIPQPEYKRTLLCGFKNERKALESILSLLDKGITPSILEFIDALSVKGAEETVGVRFFDSLSDPSVILIELDGNEAQVEKDYELVQEWANRYAEKTKVAESEAAAEELWTVRRKCSGAMFRHGNSKLNEDVVVALSKMPDLMDRISSLRKEYSIPIAVFGHAGDGNLHVNIMYDRENAEMSERAKTCLLSVMKTVVSLNGAISGEHGVGLAKSNFIELQLDPVQIQLMKNLKTLFDPNDILNPGKIFDPFSPWDYEKEQYQFPWDKK